MALINIHQTEKEGRDQKLKKRMMNADRKSFHLKLSSRDFKKLKTIAFNQNTSMQSVLDGLIGNYLRIK